MTPREGAYTSLPLDYRSKQANNVLVTQHERAASHIIAGEKLGDFLLECDWSLPGTINTLQRPQSSSASRLTNLSTERANFFIFEIIKLGGERAVSSLTNRRISLSNKSSSTS